MCHFSLHSSRAVGLLGVKDALLYDKWLIVSHQNAATQVFDEFFLPFGCRSRNPPETLSFAELCCYAIYCHFSFLTGLCPRASEMHCFCKKIGLFRSTV